MLGGALVAILVALYFGFAHRASEDQLDTAASAEPFLCLADGEVLSLTPAQFERKMNAGEIRTLADETSRGSIMKLKCPKCGQFTCVIAAKCPKDGSIVPRVGKDGQPGKCPKCGGNPFEQPG